jgi:hypothetical protein
MEVKPPYPVSKNPVPVEQKAGWAPKPIWAFWRREKSLASATIQPQPHNYIYSTGTTPQSHIAATVIFYAHNM